ncbi:hypothetical protein ABH920_002480 [Catenulispora sp. EB89]|uniref:hypothetical protein n=1 Tax=Catenulispora sp. EB89 TaxID=3156257 RepID=UPI0035145FF8
MTDPTRRPTIMSRRTVIRSLAVSSIAAPAALAALGEAPAWATGSRPAATPLWHPVPAVDKLNAFEGVEADRGHRHPNRTYVLVEDADHYRLNIWHDDLDTTGNNDRQRTEVKGMVQNGTAFKMLNGQTWQIEYAMYMPSTLHGTSRFTHIFQTKTVDPDAGPWCTLDLTRGSGGTEMINARAYGTPGAPDIAAGRLAPLRDKWVTVQWTLTIGQRGAATFALLDGTDPSSPVYMKGSEKNVVIPANTSYVRPKWGIYRSIESAPSDIIDTYILFKNYTATRLS